MCSTDSMKGRNWKYFLSLAEEIYGRIILESNLWEVGC
jgi:hypothetical protein